MTIIVAKFGGTSISNLRRMERCMNILQKIHAENKKIVVVVSAMAGFTNKLAHLLTTFETASENHDLVLSTGEQISVGIFSLMLKKYNLNPVPLLGWQLPIKTDSNFSNAKITNIETKKILNALENNQTPVVAGFQGITDKGEITTLGRSGSDTTAVALAKYLNADECHIYSDVEGIYTADPRIIHSAKKLSTITFSEMAEISKCGARVLHADAAQEALKHKLNVRFLSSFIDDPGTLLTKDISEETRFASLHQKDNKLYIIGKNIKFHTNQIIDFIESMNIATLSENSTPNKIELETSNISKKELIDLHAFLLNYRFRGN